MKKALYVVDFLIRPLNPLFRTVFKKLRLQLIHLVALALSPPFHRHSTLRYCCYVMATANLANEGVHCALRLTLSGGLWRLFILIQLAKTHA